MQIQETILPICVVKGGCMGLEFNLDRDIIPFGSVARYCEQETKLKLINLGDIGAK